MSNETVRGCKYYDKYGVLMQDMERIKKSDTLQEASLETIKKDLNEANDKRVMQSADIHHLSETVHDTHMRLITHMEWEEKLAEVRDKDHKEQEERERITAGRIKTVGSIVFMIVFGLATWFTGYVFNGLKENNENILVMKQYQETNDKKINRINSNIEDIKKMLYPLTGGK